MAMIVEDNDFSHGDAEASITHPVKCSTLRKGGHIVISRFPCRIVELSTAQPGKHGHSKVHIIGVDIFTGKKHEDICPSKENVEVPIIVKCDYQLVNVADGFLELMDQAGRLRDDIRLPSGQLGGSISSRWDKGECLSITVLSAMQQISVIALKAAR